MHQIRKLEELSKGRAVALSKAEAMLEEDAARFDTLLRENDERLQEALRKADAKTRAKQEKANPVKTRPVVIHAHSQSR